jgi:hypothetical protein
VLVGYTPLAVHLPHEHVAPASTQSAEVVDIEDCFALGQIEPNVRDSNVSQIVREPPLKVAWFSSLQFLAADENGRYTTRQLQLGVNVC